MKTRGIQGQWRRRRKGQRQTHWEGARADWEFALWFRVWVRVSRSSLTRGVPLSKVSVTSVFTRKVVRFSFSGSTARVP